MTTSTTSLAEPRKRRVPTYTLHKRSGLGRCRLNGRSFYFGPWEPKPPADEPLGPGRAACERKIDQWKENGYELVDADQPREPLTADEALAEYAVYCFGNSQEDKAHGRYVNDRREITDHGKKVRRVMRVIRQGYGHRYMRDFGSDSLDDVYQGFLAAGQCRKTANEALGILHRMFKWMVRRRLIFSEQLVELRSVEGLTAGEAGTKDHPPRMPVSREAMEAVKPFVSRQVWAIISLQDCCGARPTELLSMRPCDLQLGIMVDVTHEDGQVEPVEVWRYTPAHHKTEARGKIRCIELGPRAQEIIQPFLAMRPLAAFIFSPVEAEHERRAKMAAARKSRETPSQQRRRAERANRPPRAGDRYTRDSYRRSIRRACSAAKIDSWFPYQIRHRCATRLDEAENLEVVQAVLGNSAESAAIYVHRSQRRASQAMAIHG